MKAIRRRTSRILNLPGRAQSLLALGLCLASCLSACSLDGFGPFGKYETLTVILPAGHPALTAIPGAKEASWTVYWYDAAGSKQSVSGVQVRTDISVEAGLFTPVIAVPETDGSGIPPGTLPCAGGLYPANAKTGERMPGIELSWLSGISAECAETVCLSATGGFETGRIIAAHFNWERFTAKIGTIEDPSAFDRKRLIAAILDGDVAAWDIAKLKAASVDVSLPQGSVSGGSQFFASCPLAKGFSWVSDGITLNLPDGASRFFCQSGFISIEVKNGTAVCAFFTPYDLQD
mgnify:CR=1 FL=1